ncbi:MerR family transcriptional regulator [Georgenia alba]|uniref:MerR family transcriptional regulator n=1 Tax=Georgenia alba TaxID=2233858 RepID=A0ABW2Q413_9MICO
MLPMLGLNVDMKSSAPSEAAAASRPEPVSIGEVAARFGLATHVLRHWESVGLLDPARRSGQRRYGPVEYERIATILRAKEAGLGLEQISAMLTTTDPQERRDVLRDQQRELRRTIAAAERALTMISHVLECDHEDFIRCPHYRAAMAALLGTRPS